MTEKSEYSLKLLEKLEDEVNSCINCGFCESVCPTLPSSGFRSSIGARGRVDVGKEMIREIKGKGVIELKGRGIIPYIAEFMDKLSLETIKKARNIDSPEGSNYLLMIDIAFGPLQCSSSYLYYFPTGKYEFKT